MQKRYDWFNRNIVYLFNLMFMVPYILVTYIYVQFKIQLDVLFYVFYIILYS
jgi:hypothetical protein